MISFEKLTVRQGRRVLFQDFSLEISAGGCFGLLGDAVAGRWLLDSLAKPGCGYVPASGGFYPDLTTAQNLELFRQFSAPTAQPGEVRAVLDQFGLASEAKILARRLAPSLARLLALACAVIQDPPVLLLEEPALGSDLMTRRLLVARLKDLRREGKTFVISAQDPDLLQELCSEVVLLREGQTRKRWLEGARHFNRLEAEFWQTGARS